MVLRSLLGLFLLSSLFLVVFCSLVVSFVRKIIIGRRWFQFQGLPLSPAVAFSLVVICSFVV
ncbi:hypothetical protein V1509DRAFT_636735, partial [Lipomyces kononenkoae]